MNNPNESSEAWISVTNGRVGKRRSADDLDISDTKRVNYDSVCKEIGETSNNNQYYPNDKGPYRVLVTMKKDNGKGKLSSISAMLVGRLLLKSCKTIDQIIKKDRNTAEVYFKSRIEANNAIFNQELKSNGMSVFIPRNRVLRRGVIRDVPQSHYTEQEVIDAIHEEYANRGLLVLEARRLTRRLKNEEGNWIYVPTSSMQITFAGQELPEKVIIDKAVTKVEPYVTRVKFCYKCLNYGHFSNECKWTERCFSCGEEKVNDHVCEGQIPRCARCKGHHKTTSSECPVFQYQKNLRKVMAYENLTYKEAKAKIQNLKKAPINTIENFPTQNRESHKKPERRYRDVAIFEKQSEQQRKEDNHKITKNDKSSSKISKISDNSVIMKKFPVPHTTPIQGDYSRAEHRPTKMSDRSGSSPRRPSVTDRVHASSMSSDQMENSQLTSEIEMGDYLQYLTDKVNRATEKKKSQINIDKAISHIKTYKKPPKAKKPPNVE